MAKRLNELQKGDKVAYTNQWYSTGWGGSYLIWQPAIVERDTDTQITVKGERFNRRNGVRVGDGDGLSRLAHRIQPWSDEIEQEIKETEKAIAEHKERLELLGIIEKVKIRDLSLEQLRKIAEAIKID